MNVPAAVRAAEEIQRLVPEYKLGATSPVCGVVLGSGLGDYVDGWRDVRRVPYESVDGMPRTSVHGHAGALVFGRRHNAVVVALQGRSHLYEGISANDVAFGVRVLGALGVRDLVITNAAGGINTTFNVGSFMLISDHINLTGHNPLVGPNDDAVGPRFPDMTEAYDSTWLNEVIERAANERVNVTRGVYVGVLGPSYETPAEIRAFRQLGADAVGMSTVLEAIAARHLGMRVCGISCITNAASGASREPLSHASVRLAAAQSASRFATVVDAAIDAAIEFRSAS